MMGEEIMSIYFFKDKFNIMCLFLVVIVFVIFLTIELLDLIRSLINYRILKLELMKTGKNMRYKICLSLLKLVYKSLDSIYNLFYRLRHKIKVDTNLLCSLIFTITIFLQSIKLLYSIVYIFISVIFIKITLVKDAYAYFTLTIVLTIVAYFPDKVGLWVEISMNRFFKKISKKKIEGIPNKELDVSKSIIILLRPKLWVYFVSILFTIISSFEKISNKTIFSNHLWIQIKPIAFEAVISFIVIDRFVNLFKNEYKKINEEAKKLINK